MIKIHPELRFVMSLDSGGDPWGWAMTHMFAICHTLYLNDELIPTEWEFRPGLSEDKPRDDWPDCEYEQLFTDGLIDGDDLRLAGRILTRYLAACER